MKFVVNWNSNVTDLRTRELQNLSCVGERCDKKALGQINKSSKVTCKGQSRQSNQSVAYVEAASLGQSRQSDQSITYVEAVSLGQSRQSNQSVASVKTLTTLGYK
jgi:hypothetical protein